MKQDLRKKYLDIRRNIIGRDNKNDIIYNKIIDNKYVSECNIILIYVSYNYEVDTIKLINYFLKNKKVAVPRVDNGIMNFYYISSLNELRKNYYGILEPINNDMVNDYSNCVSITPGVCFSKLGYRIGYGKGFYDKFYSIHDVYKIGVCYKECLVDNIGVDKYDVAVNEVITD